MDIFRYMSQNYVYKSSLNNNISITTYGNENLENKNFLIFVHGFKGFKDWGFVPYQAKYFKENTEILKIYGTGHTFDVKHPFEHSTKACDKVLENTYLFFNKSFEGSK